MTFTLPQKPNASEKCKFNCGIEFTFRTVLDTDGTWIFQAVKPDEPDWPCELTYEYEVFREDKTHEIYSYERFHTVKNGHWYDLLAEISEQGDEFFVRLRLREVIHHDE
jgi:hypothetical protein